MAKQKQGKKASGSDVREECVSIYQQIISS